MRFRLSQHFSGNIFRDAHVGVRLEIGARGRYIRAIASRRSAAVQRWLPLRKRRPERLSCLYPIRLATFATTAIRFPLPHPWRSSSRTRWAGRAASAPSFLERGSMLGALNFSLDQSRPSHKLLVRDVPNATLVANRESRHASLRRHSEQTSYLVLPASCADRHDARRPRHDTRQAGQPTARAPRASPCCSRTASKPRA